MGGTEPDKKYGEIAKPYRNEMDFAFFAVNFGYSKADYDAITPREKAFIYKEWEKKLVSDSYLIYNAAFTATYNVNRKKGKKPLKLWKKRRLRKIDADTAKENMEIVREVERREGNDWIKKIYQSGGITRKKGGDTSG